MGGCVVVFFFFSSRRRHTRLVSDWSSDVCSSDLACAQHVPVVRKPRKAATEDELKQYRAARKDQNLSTAALRLVEDFRQLLDQKGAADRSLLVPVDGSFCNQTFFKTPIPKVDMLARCRKDARLCFPAPAESRRKYAAEVFTPEDVRKSNRLDLKQP